MGTLGFSGRGSWLGSREIVEPSQGDLARVGQQGRVQLCHLGAGRPCERHFTCLSPTESKWGLLLSAGGRGTAQMTLAWKSEPACPLAGQAGPEQHRAAQVSQSSPWMGSRSELCLP